MAAALLMVAGCMQRVAVDAPPKSVVFFTANSADLDDGAKQVLGHVVTDALANPARTVYVEGYADAAGSAGANQALSKLRVQVVADGLVARGVPAARIVQRPRGSAPGEPGEESRRVDVSFGR